MRSSRRMVVIGVGLAILITGCYRTRPVAVSDLPPLPRVQLRASEGFRFVPVDPSGVMAAETCTARFLTGQVTELRPDTLVLREVSMAVMNGGSATCRGAVSVAVVPSQNRALRIGVVDPTPERAFAYGLLTGTAGLVGFFFVIFLAHIC